MFQSRFLFCPHNKNLYDSRVLILEWYDLRETKTMPAELKFRIIRSPPSVTKYFTPLTGNSIIPGKILKNKYPPAGGYLFFVKVSGGSVNDLFRKLTHCISRLPPDTGAFSSDKAPASSTPLHRSNRPSFLSQYGTA